MRLVQVTIPAGKRQAILRSLDDAGIDYVVTDETSGREYTGVVYFPIPTNAVEDVLEDLREAGVDEDAYTVVVDAETVVSRKFEALEEAYAAESEGEERIARDELRTRAEDLASSPWTFVTMTVVSAIIATAGILLDSPATVVGSMVIAPLIGPAMAASVGTVIDEPELFRRGVRMQVLGVVLSIASAAVFAFFLHTLLLVPPTLDPLSLGQVRERVAPDFLSLVVALGAGVAGVISLSTGVSTALVGVMIAVALIPPAATVGIALAYGLPTLAVGSAVLVAVNVLSINLAALVVLWYTGYRPESWFAESSARAATLKRVTALVAAIAVLSLFLGGVTVTSYQHATFQNTAKTQTQDVLDAPEYADLSLLEFEARFERPLTPLSDPTAVRVVVGRPAGGSYPELAERVRSRIADATGYRVAVTVRFVEIQNADDRAPAGGAAIAPGRGQSLREGGISGSNPMASTAASRTA